MCTHAGAAVIWCLSHGVFAGQSDNTCHCRTCDPEGTANFASANVQTVLIKARDAHLKHSTLCHIKDLGAITT